MEKRKRILAINAVPYGSTGRIMRSIADESRKALGIDYLTFYGNWKDSPKEYMGSRRFGFKIENAISGMIARITGFYCIGHLFGTLSLIHRIKKFKPDIIHLHNLHLWVINVPMLFNYIKRHKIPVVWTFHDCWPVTGQCTHFMMAGCDKWKSGCHHCSSYRNYPPAYIDQTKFMWLLKRKWFSNVQDMTIVTPSKWLKDIVSQSYMNGYPSKVINNGINLDIFKPTPSDIRERYSIGNKKIVLGVASNWGKRKGLDVFVELAHRLSNEYCILLVGTNKEIDSQLPKDVISVHKTNSQEELAGIYTEADVFVNPTREDTYPTVNMEALACGTPVVTFRTGGSSEIVDETCGSIVDYDDVSLLHIQIVTTCQDKLNSKQKCIERAKTFNQQLKFGEYVRLYDEILKN